MDSIFRFFARFRSLLLFVILEVAAFMILLNGSYYQRTAILNGAHWVQSVFYAQVYGLTQYFSLKEINATLAEENNRLRQTLSLYQSADTTRAFMDTLAQYPDYKYTMAAIIDNSVNRQHNYLTLNVGKKHGIEQEMGVIADEGVVGIVAAVSERYSLVKSLLNTDWKVSARLLSSGAFGPMQWDGKNYREALLTEIPQHIEVQIGDTVVTSGYSSIFPAGIPIGKVKSFEVRRGNFYVITVSLFTDFKRLRYVNVTQFTSRDELDQLQSTIYE